MTLDLQAMQTKFSDADQERKMIVHEQLLVMERYVRVSVRSCDYHVMSCDPQGPCGGSPAKAGVAACVCEHVARLGGHEGRSPDRDHSHGQEETPHELQMASCQECACICDVMW